MATNKNPILPLPEEGIGSKEWWTGQLDWAAEIRRGLLPEWRKNANAYRNRLKPPRENGIRVPVEFEKTEQKRWQLFYRLPALKLRPSPRTSRDAVPPEPVAPDPMMPPPAPQEPRDLKKAVAIFREVLTVKIGPDGANMKPTMDENVFDALCPSGIAFSKVGYERSTDGLIDLETGAEIPDPEYVPPPGTILGLNPTPMIQETVPAPNVVYENYYFERISPAQGLVPPEFRGSDYSNKAPWLAHEFPLTADQVEARKWKVPESTRQGNREATTTTITDDDRIIELDRKGQRTNQHKCREVFYFASQIDPTVKHPKRIRRLVFVDGEVVCHEDLKDQKWDEKRGRLIGGLTSNPIKVLTLRYVSDCPLPPSDCSITRVAADELSEFRTGMMEHRRKAVPRVGIDITKVVDEKIKKRLKDGKHYDDIICDGDPTKLSAPISHPVYPNDNFIFEQRLVGQIDRCWALGVGANPSDQSGTTATEVAAIERATANRLDGEREKVTNFWLDAVKSIAQLVQLYADTEDYVEIVGEGGAKELEAWDKETIAGEFIFEAIPDSSLAPDAEGDREQELNWHNLTANDPYFDPLQNRKRLADAFGKDTDMVREPPPPPQPEEKPKPPTVSVSMRLEDLLPGSPLAEIGFALLTAQGVDVKVSATTEAESPVAEPEFPVERANVIDRDRARVAQSDQKDQRAGGLVGAI